MFDADTLAQFKERITSQAKLPPLSKLFTRLIDDLGLKYCVTLTFYRL